MTRFPIFKAVVALILVSVPAYGQRHGARRSVYRYSAPARYTYATVTPSPQTTVQAPTAPSVSPEAAQHDHGFTAWLNSLRASCSLGQVLFDADLSSWAAQNNAHQVSRGMGHFVMGSARRQNSGMGEFSTVCRMWVASPAHLSALLDPTISFVGIAGSGAYWTYNAR